MFLGIRTDGDYKDISEDKCAVLANMNVERNGELSSRNGFVKENTTALDGAIKGLFGFQPKYKEVQEVITAHTTKLESI